MSDYLKTNPAGLAESLRRQAKTMDPYQWVRELPYNVPLDGTRCEISLDDIDGIGEVIVIRDNGAGFSGHGHLADDLRRHVATLHDSGPETQDRYGLGGRIATVPFNPDGVSFISRRPNGEEAWVMVIETASGYKLKDERIDGELSNVFSPLPGMLEDWQQPSGTTVLLHGGRDEHLQHRKGVEYDSSEIIRYLRERFLELPHNLSEIAVWDDNDTKPQFRHFVGTEATLEANAVESGAIPLAEGITAWWYLLDDKQHGDSHWARGLSTICLLVGDEMYNRPTKRGVRFGYFGIGLPDVARRVVILVDVGELPEHFWPNDARTRIVTHRDADVPWMELGAIFAEHMPDCIRKLLDDAFRPEDEDDARRIAKAIDPEFLKRMKSRPTPVLDDDGDETVTEQEPLPSPGKDAPRPRPTPEPDEETKPVLRVAVRPDGEQKARKKNQPNLPKPHWVTTPAWIAPRDNETSEEPVGHGCTPDTVAYVNGGWLFLHRGHRDVVKQKAYWAERMPHIPVVTVDKAVEYSYGLYATAKYVYLQWFVGTTNPEISADLFADPEQFTIALGGQVEVDALIQNELELRLKEAKQPVVIGIKD
jgi:hypothetical protein